MKVINKNKKNTELLNMAFSDTRRVFEKAFVLFLIAAAGISIFVATYNALIGVGLFNIVYILINVVFFLTVLTIYKKINKVKLEIITIAFINFFTAPVMWFHSRGINGGFQFTLFLIVTCNSLFLPRKLKKIFNILFVSMATALIAIEYFYPSLFTVYDIKTTDLTNAVLNYITSLICVSVFIYKIVDLYVLQQKKLKKIAETDVLTGIYNRKKIIEIMENDIKYKNEINRGKYISVIDIDDFKGINDNFGHRTGDTLLKEIVNTIKNTINDKKTCFGRFGGDEFLIYFSDMCEFEVMENMKCIFNEVRKNNSIKISFGVEKVNNHENIDSAINSADIKMYEMKKKNKKQRIGVE